MNAVNRVNDLQNAQYPCRECNKVFNRQGNLEPFYHCFLNLIFILERLTAHMAAHRPHRCTISNCGKEFKFKAHLARHCAQAHGIAMRSGSPRPIMKTRAAFYLHTAPSTKIARRICTDLLRPRHVARTPFAPINTVTIKQECMSFASGLNLLNKQFLIRSNSAY